MDVRIALSMTDDLIAAVDEWRRVQPDIPPRSEAIRRLAVRGLSHDDLVELLHLNAGVIEGLFGVIKGRSDLEAVEKMLGDVKATALAIASEMDQRLEQLKSSPEQTYSQLVLFDLSSDEDGEENTPIESLEAEVPPVKPLTIRRPVRKLNMKSKPRVPKKG